LMMTNLDSAARALLAAGPDTVIIKQGRAGALLASEQIHRHIPICPDDGAVDLTGAGDSFAGGLVAHLAVNGIEHIERAVVMAAATASFAVEGFGLEGLLRATADDVRRRADVLAGLLD